MMKHLVLAIALTAAAGPALAISRYNATSMTCEAARAAIRSEGAVILRYPSTRVAGMTLYDRYVLDSDYCDDSEYAERAYVPTRDQRRCPVLACEPKSNYDGQFFIPRNRL